MPLALKKKTPHRLTGKSGKVPFVLKAANRQVILTSETYESLASCKNGIASVKKNAGIDAAFDRKTPKDGRPYFTLVARNKEVIGTSQMYASASGRSNGIRSVKANAAKSAIVDSRE